MKPEKRFSEDKPEKLGEYDRDQLIEEILKAREVLPSSFRVYHGWTRSWSSRTRNTKRWRRVTCEMRSGCCGTGRE
jgi:hypothetical protein